MVVLSWYFKILLTSAGFLIRIPLMLWAFSNHSDISCFTWQKSNYECWVCWLYLFVLFWWKKVVNTKFFKNCEQNSNKMMCAFIEISLLLLKFKNGLASETFKAYVSEEILNWHCLSLSLNADLCIHFYWLSRLRQASHRKMIQSSVLRLRLCDVAKF